MITVIIGLIIILIGIFGMWLLIKYTDFTEDMVALTSLGLIFFGAIVTTIGLVNINSTNKELNNEDVVIIERVIQSEGDLIHIFSNEEKEKYNIDLYISTEEIRKILGKDNY